MGASVQDISSKARVSRSTVYDVLRDPDDKRYNERTRKRVLKVASEMQYVPNSLAKALRRNSSQNIGIVGAQWPDPHTDKGIGAADRIVSRHNHHLMVITARSYRDWHRIFTERKVDLLITVGQVSDFSAGTAVLGSLRERIVAVYPSPEPIYTIPPYWGHAVMWDDQAGAASVAEHLLELGHRELAVLTKNSVTVRTLGFVKRCLAAGVRPWVVINTTLASEDRHLEHLGDLVKDRLIQIDHDSGDETEAGAAQLQAVLEHAPAVTGVFCRNDLLAAGAVVQARRSGRPAPQAMAIAGYSDSIQWALAVDPPLTTVRTPISEAIELVLERYFKNGLDEPLQLELDTQLLVRQSTGPAAATTVKC